MPKENYLIQIEDIQNALGKTLQINFEEHISEFKSKYPLKADLEIKALGEFIEVKGNIKGSILLECDLCLDEYEYQFDFNIDELFAKNALSEEYAQETELKEGQFITDLDGAKELDVYDLLYQSVILDLPNKKVCGINCKGDVFLSEENFEKTETDPRLDVFKNIKIK